MHVQMIQQSKLEKFEQRNTKTCSDAERHLAGVLNHSTQIEVFIVAFIVTDG